jgi:hypothetical protein
MKSLTLSILMVAALAASLPAAGPRAAQRVLASQGDLQVVEVRVSGGGRSVYGIDLVARSGAIDDVVAPKGWVAIASGDRLVLRTQRKPLKPGQVLRFRVITTGGEPRFVLRYRDGKTLFGPAESL